jgi:hypothetical protein
MVTQDSRVTTQSIYSHRTDRRKGSRAGARKIGNHLLHQAFYLTNVLYYIRYKRSIQPYLYKKRQRIEDSV